MLTWLDEWRTHKSYSTAYDRAGNFIYVKRRIPISSEKAKKNFFIKFYQRHCSSDKSNMLLVPLFSPYYFALEVYLSSESALNDTHTAQQLLYWIQACSPTQTSLSPSSCVTHSTCSKHQAWMKNCVFRECLLVSLRNDGDDDKTVWNGYSAWEWICVVRTMTSIDVGKDWVRKWAVDGF